MAGTSDSADWINEHEAEVLAGTHVVPDVMLGPAAPVTGLWAPTGVESPEARHRFALNTCSGCHQAETQTPFLHVANRAAGDAAELSGFLTGTTVEDPVSGAEHRFDDLDRRVVDLCNIVRPGGSDVDIHAVDIQPACN